jgi:hypothetical protein
VSISRAITSEYLEVDEKTDNFNLDNLVVQKSAILHAYGKSGVLVMDGETVEIAITYCAEFSSRVEFTEKVNSVKFKCVLDTFTFKQFTEYLLAIPSHIKDIALPILLSNYHLEPLRERFQCVKFFRPTG